MSPEPGIDGFEIEFESPEHLKKLRDIYRESHIFRRFKNVIQVVPIIDGAEQLGTPKRFTIIRHFSLYRKLIEYGLLRVFEKKNLAFIRKYPSLKIINRSKEVLSQLLKGTKAEGVLFIYPQYNFEVRLIVPHGKTPSFGILVDFSSRRLIKPNVKELINNGVNVIGKYVLSDYDKDSSGNIADFQKRLMGKIIDVNDEIVTLDDFREDEQIEGEKCYLEPSLTNFDDCLRQLVPDKVEYVNRIIKEKIYNIRGAEFQLQRLKEIRDWLEDEGKILCSPSVTFEIASNIDILTIGTEAGTYTKFSNPHCVLRPGGSLSVPWPVDNGLISNGPYDADSFPQKTPFIAVVCPDNFKGETEQFLRQFLEGVTLSENQKNPYSKGFVRKFHLNRCSFDLETVDSAGQPANAYKDAILEILKRNTTYDFAIVVIKNEFHQLSDNENPYLISKSLFMSHGIPVQEIEIETIRLPIFQQRYILNNIAVACYAKMGGVPWVLSSASPITHELIIGIGSAQISKHRLSNQERVIGIATVFSGDGNYQLTVTSKEVDFSHYQQALLESLKQCLTEVQKRFAWQPGDKVRLIFHQSFKKYREIEADAVKDFVESISDYETEYAFVHISDSHPWKLFDEESTGAQYWSEGKKLTKGKCVPFRGICLPLGPNSTLVTLVSSIQLKHNLQGCPSPLLISLHKSSTFRSLEYIAQQVYRLSFMSWRSFFPSTLPVTIYYSNLIATLLGMLKNIPNWNPDILSTTLKSNRWFL